MGDKINIINSSDNENDKDFNNFYSYKENLESDNSIDYQEINSNTINKNIRPNKRKVLEAETGPILPEGHRFDKKLICLRYPGKVINQEKAIETLGGLSSISTAVNTPNRRLELRFRPSDGYCKPACGDRYQVSGFLLRIRIKKLRIQPLHELLETQKTQNYRHVDLTMPDTFTNKNINDKQKIYMRKTNKLINTAKKNLNNGMNNTEILGNSEIHVKNKNNNDDIQQDKILKNYSFGRSLQKNISSSFDHQKCEDLTSDENYKLPILKVLGRIATEFRFSGLCDFQFLPIMQNFWKLEKKQCIYEFTYPIGILPYKWLDNEASYFLPPAVFSRMDSVQQYSLKTESKETGPENVIGKTRKRRAGFSNFIHFNSPFIPMMPPKGIEMAMKVKFLSNPHFQLIHSLFEERPIWSKTALMYRTNFTSEQLKILLPSVAYYFITGPWRIMWVKLGYDPRKDPSSRIYQTLDYRLKSMHGLEQTVKGKRTYSNYILPYKSAAMSKPKTAVLTNMTEIQHIKKSKEFNDDVYIYRDGMIPPSRQMFYQYCDVHVEEIQEMLAKLPDSLLGTKCHEKRGWLPSGFSDRCREIINKQVRVVLRKKMNIPEDHPTSLPKKRKVLRNSAPTKINVKRKNITEKFGKFTNNESNSKRL